MHYTELNAMADAATAPRRGARPPGPSPPRRAVVPPPCPPRGADAGGDPRPTADGSPPRHREPLERPARRTAAEHLDAGASTAPACGAASAPGAGLLHLRPRARPGPGAGAEAPSPDSDRRIAHDTPEPVTGCSVARGRTRNARCTDRRPERRPRLRRTRPRRPRLRSERPARGVAPRQPDRHSASAHCWTTSCLWPVRRVPPDSVHLRAGGRTPQARRPVRRPAPRTTKAAGCPAAHDALHHINPGGDLLSRESSLGVPSARRGLTALFGMGRGVSLSLQPPENHEGRTLKTA